MKSQMLAIVLGTALAIPVAGLAQTASESMHEAGQATESSASSAGHAIVDTWHGAKTATIDSDTTAKVKIALDKDTITKHQDIHVKTQAGIVTLRGTVPSAAVSDRARQIAEQTSGVKGVRDRLTISTASK
jgi:hyperosmotically inducible periplasmic protein